MVTITTRLLQEMVSKSIKGCSNNKVMPMTSIMAIKIADGSLTLMTTDMTNYLYVSESVDSADDFYVTVKADKFVKLIMGMTTDNVGFEIKDKYLEVYGNGEYKIELFLDMNTGNMVDFPQFEPSGKTIGKVSMATIKTILSLLKPALSKDAVIPCYTNYFIGDTVIASDLVNAINIMNVKLFEKMKKPIFISSELMDLIGLCTSDSIEIKNNDYEFYVISDHIKIHSTLFEYTSQYQTDDINAVASLEYSSNCEINKNDLLQALDRISLFLDDEFSYGVANLIFNADGLKIESTLSNGYELLNYVSKEHSEDFECLINIGNLKEQIKSFDVENIKIYYGREEAIKLVTADGQIISVVGLMTED